MIDNAKAKAAIMQLMELGCGFEVDLFTMLEIHQLEDGRYRVWNHDVDYDSGLYGGQDDDGEEIFDDMEDAVDRFLDHREMRHLGFDFETGYEGDQKE